MNRVICSAVALLVASLVGTGIAVEAAKRPYLMSGGLTVDYTDNRDSVESGKTDNTSIGAWVGIDYILERADRYMLDLGYRPMILYRTNPSDLQNDAELYHDLKLDGWYKPSRLVRLHAAEALNYTDDPAVDQGGGTIRRDASFFLNRATLGVEYDVSRLMRVDLSGNSMVKRYDEDLYATTGDEDSLSGTMAVGWILDRDSIFSVYGSYGVFSYADNDSGLDRGFGYAEAGISFRKELSKKLKGRADIAFKRLEYDASALGSDQSPSGFASVQYAPSPRLRLSGSAGYILRDADIEFFASQRYTDTSLRAEWDALLPNRMTLGLTGSYRIGDYRSDTFVGPVGTVAVDGKEKTAMAGVDVTYRLKEWMAVTLLAQYEDVSTDVSTPFNRTTAGIRTRFDF